MAPGGNEEVIECRGLASANFDYMATTSNVDLRSSPFKKAKEIGMPSKTANDVHELLECLVCMNLMYPPIYQVYNSLLFCWGETAIYLIF